MDQLTHAMLVPRRDEGFKLYKYDPSKEAAIIFVILFLVTTLLHLYQIIRTKTWYFFIFFVGGICEVIGYIARTISANQTPDWTKGPYIVAIVLPLIAPTLFAASIYMELGRIVLLTEGDQYLFVRRTRLTKVFVTGDVISFLMQSGGGGLLSSSDPNKQDLGSNIIVGGLFVQIIFFGIFTLCALLFHKRLHAGPTPRSRAVPWQKHKLALYLVSIFIAVRSIFRVVEFLQGANGYLMSTEAYTYGLDAALMFLAMVVMNVIHPSEVQMLTHGGKAIRKVVKVVSMQAPEKEVPMTATGRQMSNGYHQAGDRYSHGGERYSA